MQNPTSPDLVLMNAPSSPRAEGFRVLRARVDHSVPEVPPASILVTSPTSVENRHAVAANLALAMAEAGESVVLADADLHSPRLQEMLGLADGPGLIQCLESGASPDDYLQPGPLPKLSVLLAGGETDVSAPLFSRGSLSTLIAALTAGGRRAVLVGSPVLPSADADLLGTHVDGVILVVTAYSSDRSSVRAATSRLEGGGATMLGAVLDNFSGA